ncbi:MAG: hypothetical protein ACRENU_06930 [Gemmatimonadaceae bacterium]
MSDFARPGVIGDHSVLSGRGRATRCNTIIVIGLSSAIWLRRR